MSVPLIVNLDGCLVDSRSVNRGVMSPLRMESKLSLAAPQLNVIQLKWIMHEDG